MATVDYLPFSVATGNTAMDQATYAASAARQNGVSPGIGDPNLANKTWRQSSVVASMIAQFISNAINVDVLDDGSVSNLLTLYQEALTIYVGAPGQAALVHGGPDSGTANALSISAQPVITALRGYMELIVFPATASINATAQNPATLTLNNTGSGNITAPLFRNDGTPIQAGDWNALAPTILITDGASWFLTKATPVPVTAYVHRAPNGDTGTLNNPVLSVVPTLTSVAQDNVIVFSPAYTNTGAMTLNATGTAAPLLRSGGAPVAAGDVIAGEEVMVIADSAGNWRLASFGQSEVQRIVVSPIIYVRTDGNDMNDGLVNSAARAKATIANALTTGTNLYNVASSSLTVQLGIPGTYASPGGVNPASGPIIIKGDTTNQDAYIISGAGIVCFGANLSLEGIQVNTTTSGNIIGCSTQGFLALLNVTTVANSPGDIHVFNASGTTTIYQGCKHQGNCQAIWYVNSGNLFWAPNNTTTISGNMTVSQASLVVTGSGSQAYLDTNVTFPGGTVTGSKYLVTVNGSIRTNSDMLPGSTAGTASTGGIAV